MAHGLLQLEGVVAKGDVLSEDTIARLDAAVQHYWDKVQAVKQLAIKMERRVRALKAASKGNE